MAKKSSTEEFRKRLEDIHGNQFELLSEYVNNETKVQLRCRKCGNIIFKRPSKIVCRPYEGCYVCSGKNRYKTKESLQREVNALYPAEFLVLGDYIGARKKTLVKRIPCGHTYEVSPDNLLRGKGCPKCNQSHYANIVEDYLSNKGITFEREKRFAGCRNIRELPFDYYIPDRNTCIEVDGQFHYKSYYEAINNYDAFEAVTVRDKIKTDYCKDNGIKLIRLPYYMSDRFSDILDYELYANTEITQSTNLVTEYCNA